MFQNIKFHLEKNNYFKNISFFIIIFKIFQFKDYFIPFIILFHVHFFILKRNRK